MWWVEKQNYEERNSFEKLNEQKNQLLEFKDKFWNLEWYQDFEDFFNWIDDNVTYINKDNKERNLKKDFLIVFENGKDNSDIKDYFDLDNFWEWFPTDEDLIKDFIEKFWWILSSLDWSSEDIKVEKQENNQEEKLNIQEEKLNIQEEKLNIQEEKANIQEEKANIQEEKANIQEENKTRSEKIEEKKLNEYREKEEKQKQEEILLKINEIKNKYWEFFTPDLIKEALQNPEYQEWKNKKENAKNWVELFIIEKNYKTLLDTAKQRDLENWIDPKSENSNYSKLYKSLVELRNTWLDIELNDIDEELDKYSKQPTNSVWKTKVDLTKIAIDKSSYEYTKIKWERIIYWDQIVDLWKNPPEKYIKSEDWYELKSAELDYRVDREAKKDIYKKEKQIKENKSEIKQNNIKVKKVKELENLDLLSEELYKKVDKNIREKIERFSDNPENQELQKEIKNDIKKYIDWLVLYFEKENERFELENEELKDDLKILKQGIEDEKLVFKKRVLEKDEKVRESLKVIESLWWKNFPQEFFNQIIAEIQNWMLIPELWKSFDIQNIDLSNNNFWELKTEDTPDNFRENMTRFFNKAFFWNPEWKNKNGELIWFSIPLIKRNPSWTKTKTNAEVEYFLQQSWVLQWTTFSINKVRDNLRKPIEVVK